MQGLKKFTSHAPLLRKLQEDVYHQNKEERKKKDENIEYRTQECQYRRDVKGGPWMAMKEDLRRTAVHTSKPAQI